MNPPSIYPTAILLALFCASPAYALTVVECVDQDGNSSFRDSCPPEMTLKSKLELRGEPEPEEPPSAEEIARDNPVTLFVAPNCNACDLVRNLLETRGIPFAEKDASEDPQVQAELSTITEGPLVVPTVTIGEIKLTDYNKTEIESALSSVGFP
jgi:glutaredoxin